MADISITNCHVHTFTTNHVPATYPHPAAVPFREFPGLVERLADIIGVVGWDDTADFLNRLARFGRVGNSPTQAAILERVMRQYPRDTRFVVLPMDMAHIGFGAPKKDLRAQHDELADVTSSFLAEDGSPLVVPFATVFPDNADSVAECRRAITELGFKGLKIYPRLGFSPTHPALMSEIYPLLLERNLPVLSHCSRGGVKGREVSDETADRYTDPRAMLPLLESDELRSLRICLAHFGGQKDWNEYIETGLAPDKPSERQRNWLASILDLLRDAPDSGLWTDISYTLWRFESNIPFLKVFLEDPAVQNKVLFGSDYYMTRREALSERAVSVRLRNQLGEALYRKIAEENPKVWLGEMTR